MNDNTDRLIEALELALKDVEYFYPFGTPAERKAAAHRCYGYREVLADAHRQKALQAFEAGD